MTRVLIIGVLCLLALAVGLGFIGGQAGDPGTTTYKRAEKALNQGNYTSALNAYRHLLAHYPKSQWAEAAQYKIGYVLAHYLGEPRKALAALEAFLRQYQESRFADDALLLRAQVFEQGLGDLSAALSAYADLAQRYPQQGRMQAAAALGKARCLLQMKKQGALQAAEEAVRVTKGLDTEHAEALLTLGAAQQQIARNAQAAKATYERLVRAYPDSEAAQRAQERLGLLLYSLPPGPAEPTTVLLSVPAAESSAEAQGYSLPLAVAALSPYLAHLGSRWSVPALAVISGEAWSFSFHVKHPEQSAGWVTANPFLQLGRAMQLEAAWRRYPDQKTALQALHSLLVRGRPVVVFVDLPPPRWCLVIGADLTREEIYVYDPVSRYRAYNLEDFRARWAAAANLVFRLVGEPGRGAAFALLTLAPPKAPANPAAMLRASLQRLLAMNAKRLSGGDLLVAWQAYERLILLAQRAAAGEVLAGQTLCALKGTALPYFSSARRAAAEGLPELLKAAGLPDMASEAMTQALRQEADHLEQAAEALLRPSLLPSAGGRGALPAAARAEFQQVAEHLEKALAASKQGDRAARNLLARISP